MIPLPMRLRSMFALAGLIGAWAMILLLGVTSLPVWMMLPLLAAAFLMTFLFAMWRSQEFIEPGQCTSCGYDLTGLDDVAVCPECGEQKET